MFKMNVALMMTVLLAAGCGLETRTYVITKDRVGLDQGSGNGGCVVGKCPPAQAPKETTRKVYVLEITKPVPESEVKKIEETAVTAIAASVPAVTSAAVTPVADAVPQASVPARVIPVIGDEPVAPEGVSKAAALEGAMSYTVVKDDTLQKISKKVFGTYSKWYKIYKANKNKIKNPNVLRPGTVLTIVKG